MLYIWMPEADGVWHWSIGESWQSASHIEQLIQALNPLQHQEAVVFFPSCDTQVLQQTMPKSQYKKLGHEGVQYLLEEYVILPMDQMKILHHLSAHDQLSILGIAQHKLQTYLHVLNLLPIKLQALLPDYLLVPWQSGKISIAQFAGRILVRESEYLGRTVTDLAVYLDFQPNDAEFILYDVDSAAQQIVSERFSTARYTVAASTLPLLKKAKQHPFNILPKAKNAQRGLAPYAKACAYVLVSALVVQFSYDLLRWVKYKNVANETAAQAINQYQTWFGANNRITEQNLKGQFESQLRLSQAADLHALQLLSRIGPVLMQQGIVAQRVQYQTKQWQMELKGNSADSIRQLSEQLKQQGLNVELGNIQASQQGAIGQVKIQ